jgi:phosphatidate cytidylyltransferase
MKSNFWLRTFTGAIFVAILVGCIWYSPYAVGILFAVVSVIGLVEFYNLSEKYDIHPQKTLGIITGLILYYYFLQRNLLPSQLFKESFLAFILLLICSIYIIELFRNKEKPFLNLSTTIFGVIYVVIPFAFLIELGHFRNDYEPKFILGIFFLIWTNDTFAYLVGSLIGKRKLMERISPGKSWEGFIGGGVATLILAWFLIDLLPLDRFWHFDRADWLIIGGIIFIFGTLGDLVESMFKRSTGVKDSGKIIAGHGGVLDRFDSLTLAVPFIYGYLYFVKANLPHFKTFIENMNGK